MEDLRKPPDLQLCQVCVRQNEKNASIEELSEEHGLHNWFVLGANGLVSDELNEVDENELEDLVDDVDLDRDDLVEELIPVVVVEPASTNNRFLVTAFVLLVG